MDPRSDVRVKLALLAALGCLLGLGPLAGSAGETSAAGFRLIPILDGYSGPVFVAEPPDATDRLFVVERRGVIQVAVARVPQPRPFLDITELVTSGGSEQGLLGMAFHPSFASNRLFFVAYTARDGSSTVARYRVSNDPNVADPASGTVVLSIPHPTYTNHNGGNLAFGRDGYLYIGTGDGGGGGNPFSNAQNLMSLLGKMLRIDVDAGQPYAVPPSNPFVGRPDALPEIWAYGLRNPWRYSFDSLTGDLYIADVGQDSWEEINFQPAPSRGGENYGWNIMEGFHCFPPGSTCDQTGLTLPIFEYPTGGQGNCAIIGGHVYRGSLSPSIVGAYIFGDYCSGRIWALYEDPGAPFGWSALELLRMPGLLSSLAEGRDGELYVTDLQSGIVYQLYEDVSAALRLAVAPGSREGSHQTYMLTVTNGGSTVLNDLVVTDRPGAGARVIEARPSQGTCEATAEAVTCQIGQLGTGQTASVEMRVSAATGQLTGSHTARATGRTPDHRRVAQWLSAPGGSGRTP